MGFDVDFLPVGNGCKSGDAIVLRFGDLLSGDRSKQRVVVIDGGYKETGAEVVAFIKQYYQTDRVDLVISTHADGDHVAGLEVVLEELKVDHLWMHKPWNHAQEIAMELSGQTSQKTIKETLRKSLDSARNLQSIAERKKIPVTEPFVGLTAFDSQLIVLGPSQKYYESLLPGFRGIDESKESLASALLGAVKNVADTILENWNIETLTDDGETSNENNSSCVLLLNVDGQSMLFTADAGIPALTHAMDSFDLFKIAIGCKDPSFVQVPHHGSRRNVGPTILNRILGPKLAAETVNKTAFVSVVNDADSKHPSRKVMNAFKRRGCSVHATFGGKKWHYSNSQDRSNYSPSVALPFYSEVEAEEEAKWPQLTK